MIHKPFHDLYRLNSQISAQQCLRSELALRITDQYPANRQRRHTRVIPNRCARHNLYLTTFFAIPISDCCLLPGRFGVLQDLSQCWQSCSFQPRPPGSAWLARWGWLVQSSIQSQARYHTNRIRQASQAFQKQNRCITTISHDHQSPFRQPTTHLQQYLTGPVGQLLVTTKLAFVVPLRRRQGSQKDLGRAGPMPCDMNQSRFFPLNQEQRRQNAKRRWNRPERPEPGNRQRHGWTRRWRATETTTTTG